MSFESDRAALTLDHARDLAAHIGKPLGVSDWVSIEQSAIDAFAAVTGDDHWIHVDVARAARDMPDGKTIAHGLYLLSLIPRLQRQLYDIRRRGRGLNYGYDRVRFIDSVPVGSKVRLTLSIQEVEAHPLGTRLVTETIIERDGAAKPALIARHILLIADE